MGAERRLLYVMWQATRVHLPDISLQLSNARATPGSTSGTRPPFGKRQMNYLELDKEIAHLERVFALISNNDRIPLSYWHARLRKLPAPSLMPTQRERIARLHAILRALEESEEALCGEPPLRPTGTWL
jgi:hypothetical protein